MGERNKTKTERAADGSISIYLILTLCVILSLIFACMDSVRLSAGRAALECALDEGMFSLFSNFDKTLYEKYGLLFLDGGYGEGSLEVGKLVKETTEYTKKVLSPKLGVFGTTPEKLYRLSLGSADVTGYLLATDEGYTPLKRQICALMKTKVGVDLARNMLSNIYNNIATVEKYALNQGIDAGSLESGFKEIEATAEGEETGIILSPLTQQVDGVLLPLSGAETAQSAELMNLFQTKKEGNKSFLNLPQTAKKGNAAGKVLDGESTEVTVPDGFVNPLENFGRVGLYSFCMPAGRTVSGATFSQGSLVGRRTKNQGMNMVPLGEDSGLDKLLEGEYVLDFFTNFLTAKEGDADLMQYQAEYVINGSDRDSTNFNEVLNRILLIREGMNWLFLEHSSEKRAIVEAIVLVICTLLGAPQFVEEITRAVLMAWAYFESMVDIRNLLAGKKVPLWKSDLTWQTDLTMFGFDDGGASESTVGMDYKDYLRILLFLVPEDTLMERTANLLEYNKRKIDNQENFRLDNCLSAFELTYHCKIAKYDYTLIRSFGYDMEK